MKRFLAAAALVLSLAFALLPGAASAQEAWTIDLFHSDLAVRADGTVEVTETVEADFLTPRHGIYRYLPTKGKDTDGHDYAMSVKLDGVTRDGQAEQVDTSRNGDDIVWRVGDPDVTMTGTHVYVIRYSVIGAIGRFQDFDELYWNISGEGWDTPLPQVSASVELPTGVAVTQSACYTGPYGSTANDCTISATDTSETSFVADTAGQAMSVAVGFPKGLVAEPSASQMAAASAADLARRFFPFIIPLAVLIFMIMAWDLYGREKKFATIVPEYEAPPGLRPAEARAVLSQYAQASDVAVTIVDLAVRGYVRIEEKDTKLPIIGTLKSYDLRLLKPAVASDDLKPFEAGLLSDLFGAGASVDAVVSVSDLRTTFPKKGKAFQKELVTHLTTDGYFEHNPYTVRSLTGGIATGLVLPFFFIAPMIWTGALALSGAIVGVFGALLPRWTDKGHEAVWKIRGYKLFIGAVDKYRAPWMESQNVFEKTLPFAMAFGLGSKWAKTFESLHFQPPTWYVGTTMTNWSPVAFQKSLTGWSNAISAVSAPRSSGSGSGGGGFSGGGGGGGGGGSW